MLQNQNKRLIAVSKLHQITITHFSNYILVSHVLIIIRVFEPSDVQHFIRLSHELRQNSLVHWSYFFHSMNMMKLEN